MKKIFTRAVVIVSLLLVGFSVSAATAGSLMGVNAGGWTDWDTQNTFADATKHTRSWGQPSSPCWGVPGPATDADNWPMADAGNCFASTVGTVGPTNMVTPGTYKLSFIGQATVGGSAPVQNKLYDTVSNATTADVVVGTNTGILYLTFTNTRRLPADTTATGITNVKLIRPGESASALFSAGFLNLLKIGSTLRLMDLGATNFNVSATWADRAIPRHANSQWTDYSASTYKTLHGRGVPYEYQIALANQSGKDIWINIPDKATDDFVTNLALIFKYGSDQNGNPYTSTQANPVWQPLNAGLHVYVEYSNEVWNWQFDQSHREYTRANPPAWVSGTTYAVNRKSGTYVLSNGNLYECTKDIASASVAPSGIGVNIPDGSGSWTYVHVFPTHLNYDNSNSTYYNMWRLIGERIKQISDIFASVFGSSAIGPVVRPIFAGQIANTDEYTQPLKYLDKVYGVGNAFGNTPRAMNSYLYGLAGAPYWAVPSLEGVNNGPWPDSCSTTLSSCTSYLTSLGYALGSYATVNGNLYQANSKISVGATGRVAPTGTTSSITDGDGTWKYIYTYGDQTAEINQAFVDLEAQVANYVATPKSGVNVLVAWARNYGLEAVGYEGGLDTSVDNNFVSLVSSDLFQSDARMASVTQNFYTNWFGAGGGLFNYFFLMSSYDKYGTWGLTSSLTQTNTTRMNSFVQVSQATLPALTAGKLLPATLSPADVVDISGYSIGASGNSIYYSWGNSSIMYEMRVATPGAYTFTTNVYTNSVRVFVDGTMMADLPVGTNKSFTVTLGAGIHVLRAQATVPSTVAWNVGWDPFVVTLQGSTPAPLSSTKALTAFNFTTPAVTGTVTESTHTVSLTVPAGTDVTALVPAVTTTGASLSPATGIAQNFTSTVTYTVVAEDGTTQAYAVTVTVAPSPSLSSASSCVESWSCTAFNACSGGSQYRTCTDANNCGTTANEPVTIQGCSVGASSGGGSSGGSSAPVTAIPASIAPLPLPDAIVPAVTMSNPAGTTVLTPVQIRNLQMLQGDRTVVAENSTLTTNMVVFKSLVFDTDHNKVRIEIELRKNGDSFTGVPTDISAYVDSGSIILFTKANIPAGLYKFQARTKRSAHNTSPANDVSAWLPFGSLDVTDFTIPATVVKPLFVRSLVYGMRGVDVKKLQTILAKDKSIYPERITTGYFGPATKRAVKRFQDRYHLATPAQKKTANYGAVGVKTMEKLTEWAR